MTRKTVADVITRTLVTIASEAAIAVAARWMIEHRLHHVPVLQHDALVGLLPSFNIVRYVAEGI